MAEVLVVGDPGEVLGLGLLGFPTMAPGDDAEAAVRAIAGRDIGVVLVTGGFQARHGAAVALLRRLMPRAAVSVMPDFRPGGADHLDHLRRTTIKALGVDTWGTDEERKAGAHR